MDLIDEGYDCVFRVGPLADSTLIARGLRPLDSSACASPAYLERAGRPRTPADLPRTTAWASRTRRSRMRGGSAGPDGKVAVPIRSRFSVNSGQALRQAALSGLGIILQAEELTREESTDGRLVGVLPDWEPATRPMHLLFAPDRRVTPKLRSFIEFAVKRFG